MRHPGKSILKYSIHMGDEVILATMSIFYPDMFGLQGSGLWHVYRKENSDPGDQHDEEYLQQTQSRQEQVLWTSFMYTFHTYASGKVICIRYIKKMCSAIKNSFVAGVAKKPNVRRYLTSFVVSLIQSLFKKA